MKITKKLICALAAGATLVAAAPVFADQGREREHDSYRGHGSYSNHDRYENRDRFRGYDRDAYRGRFRDFDRGPRLVMQRPMIVERPVYYAEPAPMAYGIGPGAIIGAAIGSFIDYRR